MSIKELDAGQRHVFAPTPLRVQLTGAAPGVALLRALDQADDESVTWRVGPDEVVLTPEPRRLRLVVSPVGGGSFAGGTSVGLAVRTEGSSAASEQILVSATDVGAFSRHELAVLEFAGDRAVLSVTESDGGVRPVMPDSRPEFTSGQTFEGASATPRTPPPDDQEHTWLQAGRYALRDARTLGTIDAPVESWGLVLDGSASMCRLVSNGQLGSLLGLACGVHVQWTSAWPAAALLAGARRRELSVSDTDPMTLVGQVFDKGEPSSWAHLAGAAATVADVVAPSGAVLIVTDGVPGDAPALAAVAQERNGVRFTIVTTGVSARGLAGDRDVQWWEEELAGLDVLDRLPNVSAVSVRLDEHGRLQLAGSRAAEFALRLTNPMPGRSS